MGGSFGTLRPTSRKRFLGVRSGAIWSDSKSSRPSGPRARYGHRRPLGTRGSEPSQLMPPLSLTLGPLPLSRAQVLYVLDVDAFLRIHHCALRCPPRPLLQIVLARAYPPPCRALLSHTPHWAALVIGPDRSDWTLPDPTLSERAAPLCRPPRVCRAPPAPPSAPR